MPSFNEVLSKSAESIERPPLPPKGTYVLAVAGQPKPPRESKQWEVLDIQLRGVRPDANAADVDMDALKAYGDPKNILVRKSFLFDTTDNAAFANTEFQLREFLVKHLGLDASLSIKELLALSVNKQCIGVIDFRPDDNDPERIYVDLKRTAPVEA